jgi:hypothetical protein
MRTPTANRLRIAGVTSLTAFFLQAASVAGADARIPHLRPAGSATQLFVDGQP